jgi:tetratricopeptide (TPR) repeat protein
VYAIFLRDTGDLSSAAVELHQAAELDPLDRMIPNNLGIVYDWQGKHALAQTAFQHAKELIQDPPYDAAEIAFTYLLEGQLKAAQEWFERSNWESERHLGRALVAHARGDPREADAARDAFVGKFGATQPYTCVGLHAFLGDRDRAFESLEKAYAIHDAGLRAVKIDPVLRGLHGDPRWTTFLKKINLPPD